MAVRTGSVGPPIRANTMEPEVFRQIIAATAAPPGQVFGSGALAVAQQATPNMGVTVAAGTALVFGTSVATTQGAYWFYNDAAVNLAVAAAHATLDRYDIVVAQIQDAFYAGAVNAPQLAVVTGTPSGAPTLPATPASSLLLAYIYITHAETTVLNAAITDTRPKLGAIARMGSTTVTASQAPIPATITTITGLTLTVSVSSARRLRVSALVDCQAGSVATPAGVINVTDNGTPLALVAGFSIGAGSGTQAASYVTEITPGVGAHTYAVTVTFGANANNGVDSFTGAASSLWVDDVGPA